MTTKEEVYVRKSDHSWNASCADISTVIKAKNAVRTRRVSAHKGNSNGCWQNDKRLPDSATYWRQYDTGILKPLQNFLGSPRSLFCCRRRLLLLGFPPLHHKLLPFVKGHLLSTFAVPVTIVLGVVCTIPDKLALAAHSWFGPWFVCFPIISFPLFASFLVRPGTARFQHGGTWHVPGLGGCCWQN